MNNRRDTASLSMSTRDLRRILRESAGTQARVVARVAHDIYGPGGAVFIAAHAKVTERHLTWLEQRNPAAPDHPTYMDVILAQEGGRRAPDVSRGAEPPDSRHERRRRAAEASRDVAAKASDVNRQAVQVYRIVGAGAFTDAALRRPEVQENLAELNERIEHFHASVHAALDEYLVGNTLIMDLIARHDLATRVVQHGLNVAVFATEVASRVMLRGTPEGGLAAHYRSLGVSEEGPALAELQKRDLAEIFLAGFMHDCGLWHDSGEGHVTHEAAGARLLWHLPEVEQFAPALTRIVLFHSEILRMATRPGLVQVVEHSEDPARSRFAAEFYRSREDAATAAGLRDAGVATVLSDADLHKVIPVAMAEYCVTQTEGFHARSRAAAISRIAAPAQDGLYATYAVALCNAEIEVIAPRRAYVELNGYVALPGREVAVDGYQGGSMWHTDDMYSPHIVTLFTVDAAGQRRRLGYMSPHDPAFWGRGGDPACRMYIPAGRQRATLAVRVTGFMSEDVYTNILGEYELELKRQMQP